MATRVASSCGCMSLSAAARERALSSFPASANHLSVRIKNLNNSRKLRSLRNGLAEVSRVVVRASGSGDESRGDAGVIKNMELYLDDLSLEYDSVWDTKPAWCQPWTIVTTGAGVIITSWLLFHNAFLTGGAAFVISLWWFSFLYAYPLGYAEMIARRRKMMKDGMEDTYGRKRVE